MSAPPALPYVSPDLILALAQDDFPTAVYDTFSDGPLAGEEWTVVPERTHWVIEFPDGPRFYPVTPERHADLLNRRDPFCLGYYERAETGAWVWMGVSP